MKVMENKSKDKKRKQSLKKNSSEQKTKETDSKITVVPSTPDKLLDMANQYMNSNDSLEKFQSVMQDKYKKLNEYKSKYVNDISETLKQRVEVGKILNDVEEKKEVIKKPDGIKLPKNIATALEYYNMIQS
jgi:hypothetical protein